MTSVVIWRFIENKIEQNELDLPGGAGGAVGGAGRPPNITVGETLHTDRSYQALSLKEMGAVPGGAFSAFCEPV